MSCRVPLTLLHNTRSARDPKSSGDIRCVGLASHLRFDVASNLADTRLSPASGVGGRPTGDIPRIAGDNLGFTEVPMHHVRVQRGHLDLDGGCGVPKGARPSHWTIAPTAGIHLRSSRGGIQWENFAWMGQLGFACRSAE